MKKLKLQKTFILLLFIIMLLFSTTSNASYSNVTMSVVEEPICTIELRTNSYVERSVISKNLENKEITLQLKVVNNEKALQPSGEIMLVIDNSKSMLEPVLENKTREDLVISSAKTLIENILTDNEHLQIGVVSFSSNSDISKEGSIDDAKIISELTNDVDHLISSVDNIEYDGPRTNLDAGVTLAKEYFTDTTDNSHKYIIVLSDGVPNVAVNYDKNYYSDDVISKTKTSLESLSSVADNVIIMLTGISNGDMIANPSTKTYDEIISSILGTPENPTIGKFYYVTDDEIENTITETIYKDLLPVSQSFKDIKVIDTFPQEIVNNFDFSYMQQPNYGSISPVIDDVNNSITWNIPELKSGDTAIVQYKLSLNTNYDESIVGKILNTNANLSTSYKDISGQENTKQSDITPKIKLTEPLPVEIPKAGMNLNIIFSIVLIIAIAIILGVRYKFIRLS